MKDPRCLVGWHSVLRNHAPDTNGFHLECTRCQKVRGIPEPGPLLFG